MKIKQELLNIENRTFLVVVASNQKLEIYRAKDDEIEQVDDFLVETPQYSDREGFFESSGRDGVYGSGSVYENKREYIRTKFVHGVAEKLIDNTKKEQTANLYFFLPENIKNDIKEALPNDVKKKICLEFFGNYTGQHPFEYLTMIKERKEADQKAKQAKPIKAEAQKILNKENVTQDL